MKSWEHVEPDAYTLVGSHRFTQGRRHPIDRIVIHHNAGVRLSGEQVRDLWNNEREASAHYQVEAGGRITQLVHDWDTAWHAANSDINHRSIGIEHANISGPPRWQISDKTIEEGAHLVAALCHAYKLGRPTWGKNIFPHSRYTGTSCPYQLDAGGEDHDTYMRRAQWWYDHPNGAASRPASKHKKEEESHMTVLSGVSAGALNEAKLAAQEAADYAKRIETQLVGVPGPNGGRGWEQLGQNDKGQNLTVVDAIAALRHDVNRLATLMETINAKLEGK